MDLNNPAERRYERGTRRRPEVQARVHGRTITLLDYWPEQRTALAEIMDACYAGLGLPLTYPDEDSVLRDAATRTGWVGHLHLTTNKKDPGDRKMLGI